MNEDQKLVPARIISEERNLYRVQLTSDKIQSATMSGTMVYHALENNEHHPFPVIGDWVMVEVSPHSEKAIIRQVLNRRTILQRKQAGKKSEVQIMAANIDYVFIAVSVAVNTAVNIRRIERYLTMAWESGATPIILLTKADLFQLEFQLEGEDGLETFIAEMELTLPRVGIHPLSQDNFDNADFLEDYLQPGTTSVLVGPSGVGKSTLTNYLIGKQLIKIQEVRESDGKGRHTTTSRSLFISRFGGLIIDTPGIRELHLSDHEQGLTTQFQSIEQLVLQCKFSNCKHQTEPNCAILKAIEEGILSQERLQSYHKLQREVRHEQRKQSKAVFAIDKKVWKKRGIEARRNKEIW